MSKESDRKKEKITSTMVKNGISTMRNRKAREKLGWKAEWLIEGRDEMIKSLEILYNRIEQEKYLNSVNKS